MRNIKVLFTEADRGRLQPLFEQLRTRGLRVQEANGELKTSDVVLAALSENAYADKALVDRVLGLIGAGAETVLPLQLDGAAMPDALKNALYARNIIFAAERDDKLIAERIMDALPKKKNRLPLILSVAAVAFIAAAGLLIWRAAQSREMAPAMAKEPITIPVSLGLTEADLASVEDVVIVGDYFAFMTHDEFSKGGHWLNVNDNVAYRADEMGEPVWYSKEDGHAYAVTRYDDLRFLGLMPNLRFLELVNVEADADRLPELSACAKLQSVALYDCAIDSLDWLAGAPIQRFNIHSTPVADYSPLTSCEKLTEVLFDLHLVREPDFSGFGPPALEELNIDNGEELRTVDLSALAGCAKLKDLYLADLPIRDISFLAGKTELTKLALFNLNQLRDISALGTLTNLRALDIEYCPRLTDYTPIASCEALESFHYRTDDFYVFFDASFLKDLPRLKDIDLQNVDLADVDFLRGAISRQSRIALNLTGHFGDYSGLEAIKSFDKLRLDPVDDGTPLAQILPYLEGASVQELYLHNFNRVDLSALPRPTVRLELDRCGLTDLATMPEDWQTYGLMLNRCSALRSLDGLQNQSHLRDLDIYLCPRLTDWGALEGLYLYSLKIVGGYTLPDFSTLDVHTLHLESMEDVTNLDFLSGLDAGVDHTFMLIGLDGLQSLQPLRRFHGILLAVSPQLAEQAQDLVDSGNFEKVEIKYPQGGWAQDNAEFVLLSLDELDTLPKALLRRVSKVTIAGDQLLDEQRYDIDERWENGKSVPVLRDRETGEESPVEQGTITDLSVFSELTGLRQLRLYNQPLAGLDGIQELASLEEFTAQWCPALTDASALFALQGLRNVNLKSTAIASIQGVQNLNELCWLDISCTRVDDLTPLRDCDFSAADEQGGLNLSVNELDLDAEDFAALGTIRRFNSLNFTNADPAVWIPALAGSEIYGLGAAGDLRTDADLAVFAADHPELRYLYIGWAEEITDLTPLLSLENLEKVSINRNMEAAIASLDGQSYGFELNIEG